MIRVLRNMGACLIITLIFVACNTKTNSTTHKLNNQNQEHFILDTDDLSISPSVTTNPKNLITPTPVETENSIDNFIIITTPFPTVESTLDMPNDRKSLVEDIFDSKNECLLPCWNGIIPGISGNKELSKITEILYGVDVKTLGLDEDTMIHVEDFPNIDKSGNEEYPLLEIRRDNSIVTDIEIDSWDKPEYFDLSKAYPVLGLPDSIKIRVDERNLTNKRYGIVFKYDEEKIIFTVRGNLFIKNDEDYYVCLSDVREQYNDLDIYTDFPKLFDFRDLEEFPYFDWENRLGITIEELYLLLLDPTKCILY